MFREWLKLCISGYITVWISVKSQSRLFNSAHYTAQHILH
jgi:hypothetical protein